MDQGFARAAVALLLALVLGGCASEVRVTPTRLAPVQAPTPEFVVPSEVSIALPTGYSRTLAAGSRWRATGTLPEGTVYQPVGTVFTIEGRQVHEAYLVVRAGALQGFFLPAESNYAPLAQPIPFPTRRGEQR